MNLANIVRTRHLLVHDGEVLDGHLTKNNTTENSLLEGVSSTSNGFR